MGPEATTIPTTNERQEFPPPGPVLAERPEPSHHLGHKVLEFAGNYKKTATTIMVGAVAALGASAPAEAATITPKKTTETVNNVTYTETSTSSALTGSSRSSVEAFAKLKIVGNHRTVSRTRANRAIRRGQCDRLSAKQVVKLGLRTQGHNGSGTSYALENRPSTMCDTNGDGKYDFRANCGNRAKGGRPSVPAAKQTLWVNNINKANVTVSSSLVVEAAAKCELNVAGGQVTASAYGRANSSAKISAKLRSAIRAGGNGVARLETSNLSALSVSLRQQAVAQANVSCQNQGGTIVVDKPPTNPENPNYVCPPGQMGTYPNCYYPPASNQPPTGRMAAPEHMYTGRRTEICVDDPRDPDGDTVTVSNFMFKNSRTGAPTGSWDPNNIITRADGDKCVSYASGSEAAEVTVSADLHDGRGGKTTVSNNFPVLADNFPE